MKTFTVMKNPVDVKPLFFHIGWMRTGTTFLQGLFKHDDKINLSLKNRFFSYDPYFNRGIEYYQNQIILGTQTEGHLINIDSDENYSMGRFKTQLRENYDIQYNYKSELGFIYHDVAAMVLRIKECAPDAKVFGIIRKQPSWFESVYKHDVYHFGLDQTFAEFYESELGLAYRKAADYFNVYQLFVNAFKRENVKILLFEDFVSDKTTFIQQLSSYLGIEIPLKDESKLKKNASTNNFFTVLHRYANKLSEKNSSKPENILYHKTRKVVSKLDHVFNKFNINLDVEIVPEHVRKDIQQQYASNNRQLAAGLNMEEKMEKYGYF